MRYFIIEFETLRFPLGGLEKALLTTVLAMAESVVSSVTAAIRSIKPTKTQRAPQMDIDLLFYIAYYCQNIY